ncbi:MAG: glutathione S-transferase family protein [Gammaproteobacteria bacterium]|nr:glutathione S-transferase family protein [Gammaproteobacteria bacterium]
MQLYSFEESGNSYKVRLLCALLGVAPELRNVSLLDDEQHQPPFIDFNPRGEVPVLVDGELVLRDSSAILLYIAGKHGNGLWWPADVARQAKVMEWLAFAASWVQYGVFTARALVSFGIPANGLPADFQGEALAAAHIRARRSLEILETELATQAWLALGRPTIADIAVFPYIALAPMGEVSLTPYPAVRAWIDRIKQLPGFVSMPGLEDPMYRRA